MELDIPKVKADASLNLDLYACLGSQGNNAPSSLASSFDAADVRLHHRPLTSSLFEVVLVARSTLAR